MTDPTTPPAGARDHRWSHDADRVWGRRIDPPLRRRPFGRPPAVLAR